MVVDSDDDDDETEKDSDVTCEPVGSPVYESTDDNDSDEDEDDGKVYESARGPSRKLRYSDAFFHLFSALPYLVCIENHRSYRVCLVYLAILFYTK